MLKRLLQLLTLAAVVNLVYQYLPREPVGRLIPAITMHGIGLVDEKGYLAVEPEWDWIDPFDSGGLAKVKKDDEYGFINRRGEVVVPVKWNSAGNFNQAGYALVALGSGKWGLIDREGNEVIPPRCDNVAVFADSDYAVIRKKGLYGIASIHRNPPRAELSVPL